MIRKAGLTGRYYKQHQEPLLTWTGNILTATYSFSSWAFHTQPNLPLALISSNCSGFKPISGEGGGGPGSWNQVKTISYFCYYMMKALDIKAAGLEETRVMYPTLLATNSPKPTRIQTPTFLHREGKWDCKTCSELMCKRQQNNYRINLSNQVYKHSRN